MYPQWIDNIVLVPKKDEKVCMCVDYRDLNKTSLKDDFPLQHADMLVDSISKLKVSGKEDWQKMEVLVEQGNHHTGFLRRKEVKQILLLKKEGLDLREDIISTNNKLLLWLQSPI